MAKKSWLKKADEYMSKKIYASRKGFVGKILNNVADKIGGISRLAVLNIFLTMLLGTIITIPIYLKFGLHASLPTIIVTVVPVFVIAFTIIDYNSGRHMPGGAMRLLLIGAIFFSLPFSVLSIPLLQAISKEK